MQCAGGGYEWFHKLPGPPGNEWWVGSYGFNGYLYSNYKVGTNQDLKQYRKATQIHGSSDTPVFFDEM